MRAAISEVLEAVRANIAISTSVNVILGAPEESASGLYLFPYLFAEDAALRTTAGGGADPGSGYLVQCLLVTSPGNAYDILDEGLKSLKEQPVLSQGGRSIRITLSSLSADEISHIFSAAAVPLRLAVPFELRWTG